MEPLIFIVDDDRGLSRLLEKRLRREGFGAASAASGREAIAWLETHQPDLMLLDLKLDDMEGREIVRRLNEGGRAVPFIVITGQGDERVAVEMMKGGALDYLVKDARFEEMVPAVVHRGIEQLRRDKRLTAAEEELRKEHAFISAVLDTSGALVVVLDREGRIVRFNRACEAATGYVIGEVEGRSVWEVFVLPEDVEIIRGLFRQFVSEAAPVEWRHENYWMTKEGGRRLVDWTSSTLRDKRGVVEYVIATGIDITDRKRLEREILEISDREQRRIGQDLHDGLCQRLAGIELMSEVLEQRLTSKARAEASRAGDIARHVRESIDETRLLARGLSPVTVESEGLMSALHEMTSNMEKLFGVNCEFHCSSPVLVDDPAVAIHLFRIAQEAVSNALRHGKARRIQVSLDGADGRVTVAVRDDGRGFSGNHQNGSGMGLRIMRYRAGMIGGKLDIRPNPEGGAMVLCSVRQGARPSGGGVQ